MSVITYIHTSTYIYIHTSTYIHLHTPTRRFFSTLYTKCAYFWSVMITEKEYFKRVAIDAAQRVWGITLNDLRNRSDEELVLMRQIVVSNLSDQIDNRMISEIIDRSESTVETDILNHRDMIEESNWINDGWSGYKENADEYIIAFEKIEDEMHMDAEYNNHVY